jgi:hypothetical protein
MESAPDAWVRKLLSVDSLSPERIFEAAVAYGYIVLSFPVTSRRLGYF